ncbi:MAG: NAD(P)H-hydrate dehydratase [Lachnospiraceae bacterium]|nr:NAD(P)H-hydrate dehydratase [Lachnospiraceae bacterium]
MRHLLYAEEMKRCDSRTIRELGVPSPVLMERAADETAREVLDLLGSGHGRVIAVCGTGNNGGDGYACARNLHLKGVPVSVLPLGNPEKFTEETRFQAEICGRLGIPEAGAEELAGLREEDVIVDAVFGIGLSRDVTGRYAEIIEAISASRAKVAAVDIPSGIHADTGAVLGCAVRADRTVTMQAGKPGLYLYPGAAFAGRVRAAEIGVAFAGTERGADLLLKEDLASLLPVRDASGNKGSFGKVLLAAGSFCMAGAAYLAASAALAAGCGMVRILTDARNREILQTLLPEALISVYETPEEAEREMRSLSSWCDVIAAGPGLGTGEAAEALVGTALSLPVRPLVLDADALNVLSLHPEWMERLDKDVYLTPHIGEMSRLTGRSVPEIKSDLIGAAAAFSEECGAVCHLKDARSVTAGPDGGIFINTTGNDGMAAAGSGDVLTGILASLAAQGMRGTGAAAAAACLHGLAGDLAAETSGKRGMKAGDLPAALTLIMKEFE